MIPRLYTATETAFTTLGLGMLADCRRCIVTESRNGVYNLEMDYPISGVIYEEIRNERIILAKPNDKHQDQPFVITRITKPIRGVVTIYAEHISYKTNNIIVEPTSATNAASAVSAMMNNSVGHNPFTFTADSGAAGSFTVEEPSNFRSLMGGTRGSLLDVYGGEYEYDRFSIFLRGSRGQDNGVVIEYGKNLTDVSQEESIANLITAVYPFWNGEGGLVSLPEKIISVGLAQSTFERVQSLDLTGEFESRPTVAQLRASAQSYIDSSTLTTPAVSISASFEYLWQMEEYKSDPLYQQIAALERVNLCDTVTIRFSALGVDATAKIVNVVYNVLLEKYNKVDIGSARTNLSTQILEQQDAINNTIDLTDLQKAIENATNLITGATGGYVVLDPPRNPQRLLIMNTDNKATATKVWQWNINGLGYSSSGINGPYGLAMTMDGAIVADRITTGTLNAALAKIINLNATNINTGTLNADLIKAGIIRDAAGKNSINMVTGDTTMNGTFSSTGTASDGNVYTLKMDATSLKVYDSGGTLLGWFGVGYANNVGTYYSVKVGKIYSNEYRITDNSGNYQPLVSVRSDNTALLQVATAQITNINGRRIQWAYDSASGRYYLMGT